MKAFLAVGAASLLCLLFAPGALGADSVYWSSVSSNTIRVANLDGSGSAANLFAGETFPEGVAMDPSAGKIYWATNTSIRAANLDGTGATTLYAGESGPHGVQVDTSTGKIYWVDRFTEQIRVANLDGSGSPSDLFTNTFGPTGFAINPAAGKMYWSSSCCGGGAIRVANLDGTGSPSNILTGESQPRGIAINTAAGKLYWADSGSGTIRVANLNGSGATDLYTGESQPQGVAIDPLAGKIYWGDIGTNTIRVANLDGTGSPSTLFSGESGPNFPALLRAPQNTAAPAISGGGQVGQQLSCSQGSWASDLTGAQLYRAPRTFAYQWKKDGGDIAGATHSTYTPIAGGDYTCRVTATNRAGSTSQTSSALTVPAGTYGKLYWSNFSTGAIRVAGLGNSSPADLFAGDANPYGVAIDSATGKIYWATFGGAIRVANLDGTGSPSTLFSGESRPTGLAIDPSAGKLYWANQTSNAIRVANLDGSGSPSNLFTGENDPFGISVDPNTNKIYWTDFGSGQIRVANLDGSGSPSDLFTGEQGATGVAIDSAAGKIYWAINANGSIRVANLDGSGSPSNLFTGEAAFSPGGIAIDPATGRIYWASTAGAIRIANLDGSGSPSDLFAGEGAPVFAALLRAPVGTGAPAITGGGQVGQQLSCGQGSWASDLEESLLYRAPQSFAYQWQEDGADISGATQSTYTPTEIGDYSCRVTASNRGGSDSQTSAPESVTMAVPTNVSAPTIKNGASPAVGTKLNGYRGGWSGDPTSFQAQWLRCDADGISNCTAVTPYRVGVGTYVPVAADAGHTMRVRFIATNAGGESAPATSDASGVVIAPPPTNVSPPTIKNAANPVVGIKLAADQGHWTGNPTSYQAQWLRCDSSGSNCSTITAFRPSGTYVPASADVGHTLKARFIATNSAGDSAPATSAATGVVTTGVPTNTQLPIVKNSASPTVGVKLAGDQGRWTGDPTSYQAQWLRCDTSGNNCSAITAFRSSGTYVPVGADSGNTLRVRFIATNPAGGSAPATSNPSGVVN